VLQLQLLVLLNIHDLLLLCLRRHCVMLLVLLESLSENLNRGWRSSVRPRPAVHHISHAAQEAMSTQAEHCRPHEGVWACVREEY